MLTFPELSRKPAIKTKRTTVDSTLRDPLENGMEATLQAFTRARRNYDITIEHLLPADVSLMDDFEDQVGQGADAFLFTDARDPANPVQLTVRYATLPSYTDEDNTADGVRQKCTFTIRTV